MDLNDYILPLKKWWWLLVAATLVAGITSFGVALTQPPIYQAHTTLMVGQTIDNPNPNSGDFYLVQSLAAAYADMANRDPLRNATMDALGLTWLPDYVVQVVPNSQLIEIQVTDTLPVRAQRVAAELANQLILRSPTNGQTDNSSRQDFINAQLNSLQSQITSTEADITKFQQQLGDLTSAKQIADTQAQINALQAKLGSLRTNYADLLSNTQKGAINSLSVIEPASLPSIPISQSKLKVSLLASLIGFVLAAGGAYGIEFFDRTLKTTNQVEQIFNTPVIGFIAEMEEKGQEGTYFKDHPKSLVAEAFHSLMVNIDLLSSDKPIRTLLISGVEASSGKTTVAANLAYALSQENKNVLLLDADLHRPKVHQILGLPVSPGLSDALLSPETYSTSTVPNEMNNHFQVMTAGNHTGETTGLVMRKIDEFFITLPTSLDLVIIDGPPLLVADATVLASRVDGVILVIRPGHSGMDVARATMEQLRRSGARLIGVVFNRITRTQSEAYGGNVYYSPYHYYSNYLKNDASQKNHLHKKSLKNRIGETLKPK